MNSPFNTDLIASKLAETLRTNLERIALATSGVDRVANGPIELPGVFFNIVFGGALESSDATRSDAKRWLVTMGLREGIDSIGTVVDEIRVFAGLCKKARDKVPISPSRDMTVAELTEEIQRDEKRTFHRLSWPEKLRRLVEEFGIRSDWQREFLSINKVRNCLTHRGGVVGEQDLESDCPEGVLSLQFRILELVGTMPDGTECIGKPDVVYPSGSSWGKRISQGVLQFRRGETVDISPQNYAFVMFTLHLFAKGLIESLVRNVKASAQGSPTK